MISTKVSELIIIGIYIMERIIESESKYQSKMIEEEDEMMEMMEMIKSDDKKRVVSLSEVFFDRVMIKKRTMTYTVIVACMTGIGEVWMMIERWGKYGPMMIERLSNYGPMIYYTFIDEKMGYQIDESRVIKWDGEFDRKDIMLVAGGMDRVYFVVPPSKQQHNDPNNISLKVVCIMKTEVVVIGVITKVDYGMLNQMNLSCYFDEERRRERVTFVTFVKGCTCLVVIEEGVMRRVVLKMSGDYCTSLNGKVVMKLSDSYVKRMHPKENERGYYMVIDSAKVVDCDDDNKVMSRCVTKLPIEYSATAYLIDGRMIRDEIWMNDNNIIMMTMNGMSVVLLMDYYRNVVVSLRVDDNDDDYIEERAYLIPFMNDPNISQYPPPRIAYHSRSDKFFVYTGIAYEVYQLRRRDDLMRCLATFYPMNYGDPIPLNDNKFSVNRIHLFSLLKMKINNQSATPLVNTQQNTYVTLAVNGNEMVNVPVWFYSLTVLLEFDHMFQSTTTHVTAAIDKQTLQSVIDYYLVKIWFGETSLATIGTIKSESLNDNLLSLVDVKFLSRLNATSALDLFKFADYLHLDHLTRLIAAYFQTLLFTGRNSVYGVISLLNNRSNMKDVSCIEDAVTSYLSSTHHTPSK